MLPSLSYSRKLFGYIYTGTAKDVKVTLMGGRGKKQMKKYIKSCNVV